MTRFLGFFLFVLMFLFPVGIFPYYEEQGDSLYVSYKFLSPERLLYHYLSPVIASFSSSNVAYSGADGEGFVLNPSLLGTGEKESVFSLNYSHILNTFLDTTSLFYSQYAGYGSIGVSLSYSYVYNYEIIEDGKIKKDISGAKYFWSVLGGLSYGAPVFKDFVYLGGTVKYLYINKYSIYSDQYFPDVYYFNEDEKEILKGMYLDLSATFRINMDKYIYGFPNVFLSFVGRNLHPKFKAVDEIPYDSDSALVSLGFVFPYVMTLLATGEFRRGESFIFRGGLEFSPIYFLKIRGGFAFIPEKKEVLEFSLGLGVGSNFGDTNTSLSIEYGFIIRNVTNSPSMYEENPQEMINSVAIKMSFGVLNYNPKEHEL